MAIINKYGKMIVYNFTDDLPTGFAAYDSIHNLSEIGAVRSDKTKEENFKQGKMAEVAVYKSLAKEKGFVCEPYDLYRKEILKDPFDLIIYNPIITPRAKVQELMDLVYNELKVDLGIGHKLSAETREKIRRAGIITVEVKSSNVKHLLDDLQIEKYGEEELAEIKSGLERQQFFFAPLLHQRAIEDIDFHTYCQRCIDEGFVILDDQIENRVVKQEADMLSDVFIRVFMDMSSNTAFIYGGKTKEEILAPREISCFRNNKLAFFKSSLEGAFGLEDIGQKFFGFNKHVRRIVSNEPLPPPPRQQNLFHFDLDLGQGQ